MAMRGRPDNGGLVPLLGGAYEARSVIANAQRAVNVYPEKNQGDAETPVTHYPRPGLTFLGDPGGAPAKPYPAYNKLWISGSSCELMSWPLTANGNITPTINIQGSATTFTGPLGNNESFSYAADVDADGTQYCLGYWALANNATKYFFSAFSPGATGNVAPVRSVTINNSVVTGTTNPGGELSFGGLCVDQQGSIYVGLGHWIFKFATSANGTVSGAVFVAANAVWGSSSLDDRGITSLYFDIVRQVIWATYTMDQADVQAAVVGYNLDGSIYQTIDYANFLNPRSCAVGPDGSLYVADTDGYLSANGAIFIFTPPNFATPTKTLHNSSNIWNKDYLGVGVDKAGIIYLSIGGTGTPGGIGFVNTYPASSNGDCNGTELTSVHGAATNLSNMIDGTVTWPAQVRLST